MSEPLPTYPDGFPPEVLRALRDATGLDFCCNRPYDGLAAIEDFGQQHLRSGELILYTSQDAVLQLAAHIDRLSAAELHTACLRARAVMGGPHAVGRVIARPFEGPPGALVRTAGRRDYALVPPSRSYLQALGEAGIAVHAVGKVGDLFAHVGIDHTHAGATNAAAIEATTTLLRELESGLIFTNLIETDQLFGHRKDPAGFHGALRTIDAAVAGWLAALADDDLLVLCADHGCDPAAPHSDHTREHAPLLALFADHGGRRHDGPLADVGASALRWLTGRQDPLLPGSSFVG